MELSSTHSHFSAQLAHPHRLEPFSRKLLAAVAVIDATPIMLNIVGVDFTSIGKAFHLHELAASDVPKANLVENILLYPDGRAHPRLMEWSAVMATLLTTILAFSHFAINKNTATLIIGLAL